MSKNVFFKQKGPFAIGEIFKNIVLGSKKKILLTLKL